MKRLLLALLLLCSLPLLAETTTTTVAVGATATSVLTAGTAATRSWVMISVPADAGQSVFLAINNASVTTSNGHTLAPGDILCLNNSQLSHPAWSPLHAIVASGSVTIVVSYGN